MTEHDDDLDIVLRPWMHQHAPDAPSDLVLRIYGEIETMSQQPQTHRWLSRFTVWPIGAWAATIAVVAILAVAGGLFLTSIGRLSLVGDQPTPTTSSSSADPTTVADALIAAWNSGDGQQAASLYSFPQPQTQPIARFFVDSSFGDATQSYATASNIADAVGAWHAIGSTLTRTGDVLIQGPFAAYPVTWTSSDGSYNGVEVLRISTDGLVTDQYLFGASSATATGAPVDAAQLIGALRDAQNSSDGSAATTLLAPTVRASAFRDGAKDFGPLNLDDLTSSISQGTACCVTDTGGFETQGPFIVHMTTVTNATQLQGARVDGAEILQLNGDGQIAYVWRIDTLIDLASSTPTSMPSAAVSADPTAVAHDLIAAWNAGDGQQAAGLYDSSVPASQPIGRFMVDSGATTQQFSLGTLAATVSAWHDNGSSLIRTGNVVTQGPYAAYPVTWTSSDGSFNGVEVLRISPGGLVSEQYLIGASAATATGRAAGTDVVKGIGNGVAAIAARLGAGSADLFAADAEVYQFQDGTGGLGTSGRDGIAGVLLGGTINPAPAQVGAVVTQGPFAVYAASNPTTTDPLSASPTDAVEEGFTVLQVNDSGLIQDSWAIRTRSPSDQAPPSPGN